MPSLPSSGEISMNDIKAFIEEIQKEGVATPIDLTTLSDYIDTFIIEAQITSYPNWSSGTPHQMNEFHGLSTGDGGDG